MGNCILILAVAAAFIFGYFIMKKLDEFLAEIQSDGQAAEPDLDFAELPSTPSDRKDKEKML